MSGFSGIASAVGKRLGALLFTLWGATLVTFIISHIVPADVARMVAGDGASEETVEAIHQSLGLDQPLITQYFIYLGDLLRGDLGISIRTQQPVIEELAKAIPATAELALCAFFLVLPISIGLGGLAALRPKSIIGNGVRMFGALGVSVPTFWSGLLLIALFTDVFDLLPTGSRLSADILDPPQIMGLLLIDSLLSFRFDVFASAAAHLVLPAATLALGPAAAMTRLVRASLLEVYGQDYIKRVRAAGISERDVFFKYALPNAAIPMLTVLGVLLADLLVGAVVTEIIFGWPGLGTYTIEAIAGLDFPAIMGFTLFAALVYALANLLVDILNSLVDPRTKAAK